VTTISRANLEERPAPLYLVDSNVISEARKGERANAGVLAFFAEASEQNCTLFLSAISIAELRRGVDLIRHRGDAPQAEALEQWLLELLQDYGDRWRPDISFLISILLLRRAMDTTKLFWSGRSQAVRLPKQFCMDGTEVLIRRQGAAVILEPIATDWTWLDALSGPIDSDIQHAVDEQPIAQERPELDQLFG